MAEYVDVDNLTEDELKQKIRELDSGESVWKNCKKRLHQEYSYTVKQILKISREEADQ